MGKREVQGTSTVSYKGFEEKEKRNLTEVKSTQTVVYAIDLEVVYEKTNDPFMREIEKIKSREEARKAEKMKKNFAGYQQNLGFFQDKYLEGANNRGLIDVPEYTKEQETEDLARDFLYKLLSNNPSATGYLPAMLDRMELDFHEMDEEGRAEFLGNMDVNAAYLGTIDDDEYVLFPEIIEEASGILWNYTMRYELADHLGRMLEDLEIVDNV
jgi:hypothetical protein